METAVRLATFLAILFTMAILESVFPRRPLLESRKSRWINNLALSVANTATVRILFPIAAVGVASIAQVHGWGLLNRVDLPLTAGFAVGFAALDLTIYVQHRLFHGVYLFWRFHRVHHSDPDIDTTSALRFHPLEIAISMVIKMGAVVVLGAPPITVIVFETVLNGVSLFNHANLRISERVDRALRWIVVTPDMHRVHHSVVREETDSNFGFNFPWWDWLFRTYRPQPVGGHLGMRIGLEWKNHASPESLAWLLVLPFRSA